jgi:hypothetical protein
MVAWFPRRTPFQRLNLCIGKPSIAPDCAIDPAIGVDGRLAEQEFWTKPKKLNPGRDFYAGPRSPKFAANLEEIE